jgi:hypothetical protein
MASKDLNRKKPPPGDWVYKLHGDIIGPVPSTEIITRMLSGEVDESTQVSTGNGDWRAIHTIAAFRYYLSQAKARIRAARARAEAQIAAKRRRFLNVVKVIIGALLLVLVGSVASYYAIVSRPKQAKVLINAWADKHVPLLSSFAISDTAAGSDIEDDQEFEEEDSGVNIAQILIDDEPALEAIDASPSEHTRHTKHKKRKRFAAIKDKKKETKKTAMAGELSNSEITSVVYAKKNLGRLYGCIKKEIRKNTDLPSTVSMGFTINNDGRIGQVRMHDVRLENSSLHRCFKKKLSKLKFRAYSGERRNVEIPFNIGG